MAGLMQLRSSSRVDYGLRAVPSRRGQTEERQTLAAAAIVV